MTAAAVVDASVAIKWVLDEPGSDRARLLAGAALEAPELLLIECANILWKKARLGELKAGAALECLRLLTQAPVRLTPAQDLLEPALRLSLDLAHPVYDCLYLALALRAGLRLITADQRFAAAIRREKRLARSVQTLEELGQD